MVATWEEDVPELLQEYHRTGDRRAREAAIERYIPLARSLARRYRRGSEPLEDLEQVACLALVKAVDAFDASRGTAFSSYAVPCISGALKRHFRDQGWAVRVPRQLQELAMRVNSAVDELTAASGHSPTAAEVADSAGLSVEDVLEAREVYSSLHSESLDRTRHDGEGLTLLETLPAEENADDLPRVLERVALDRLLELLDDREQAIVRLYYYEELTQAEIGKRLGYSQMHVSRLLRRASARLKLCAAA
jgi:RNA polymerase sigma-B factor